MCAWGVTGGRDSLSWIMDSLCNHSSMDSTFYIYRMGTTTLPTQIVSSQKRYAVVRTSSEGGEFVR